MSNQFGTREISTSPASPIKFTGVQPDWLQIIGAGVVVVHDSDDTPRTFTSGGGEVITGPIYQLVSFTCARVRLGAGTPPPVGSNVPVATAGTAGGVALNVAPVSAASPIAVGANDPQFTNAGSAVYGDGSDGACVFDGAATILGLAPVANVYTLTRDIFASSIHVLPGVSVYAAGFRIYCSGTTTIDATGAIHNNGHDAVADAAGDITNAAGSTGCGTVGGAGVATSTVGLAGTAQPSGFPGGAGVGGAGGGDGTHAGGAAGAWTALAAAKGSARMLFALLTGQIFGSTTNATASLTSIIAGGSGGGSGAADSATTTKSGGGGGGGGVLIVAARVLVNNGALAVNGGKGGDAASTAANAGGGGGGGGGVLIVVSRASSGTGTATASGGLGGAKAGAAGVAGLAGTAGVVVSAAA